MSSLEIETERVCACVRERERELAIDRSVQKTDGFESLLVADEVCMYR